MNCGALRKDRAYRTQRDIEYVRGNCDEKIDTICLDPKVLVHADGAVTLLCGPVRLRITNTKPSAKLSNYAIDFLSFLP